MAKSCHEKILTLSIWYIRSSSVNVDLWVHKVLFCELWPLGYIRSSSMSIIPMLSLHLVRSLTEINAWQRACTRVTLHYNLELNISGKIIQLIKGIKCKEYLQHRSWQLLIILTCNNMTLFKLFLTLAWGMRLCYIVSNSSYDKVCL